MRAGCASATGRAWLPAVATGGAVHTTANTTPAGLMTANPNPKAKRNRTRRVLSAPPISNLGTLLVRKVFKLGGELTHPTSVVQAPDETAVALVASHVQELLLGDEGAQPGEVRV